MLGFIVINRKVLANRGPKLNTFSALFNAFADSLCEII